jgi:hypothetical protein
MTYAEQFHLDPQEVEGRVKLRWWYRWQTWEQARAARQAHEHSRVATNWAEELSAAELAAMRWAIGKDDGSTD